MPSTRVINNGDNTVDFTIANMSKLEVIDLYNVLVAFRTGSTITTTTSIPNEVERMLHKTLINIFKTEGP
jgi:hypothetical protein